MLQVKNISFSYDAIPVLKSISLNLNRGDRMVLVGESGCGKTTLLKTIAGYLQPDSGEIWFEDNKVKGPKDQLVPGHTSIKLVNQDFGLDGFHTVEENIRLKLLRFDKDYVNYRIEELLKVTGLEKIKSLTANQLSGGQKQRLAIARALADEPELLLLDEPFNQLDYFLKQKIENYIDDYLKKNNITVLLVSHNGEETMRWGDKVLFLKSGKIVRQDTASNFYHKPQNRKEAGFFGTVNTVYVDKKHVSFRPNAFALKASKDYPLMLKVKYLKSIDKGWYFDNLFQFGNRLIHLNNPDPISVSKIYVNPIVFQ